MSVTAVSLSCLSFLSVHTTCRASGMSNSVSDWMTKQVSPALISQAEGRRAASLWNWLHHFPHHPPHHHTPHFPLPSRQPSTHLCLLFTLFALFGCIWHYHNSECSFHITKDRITILTHGIFYQQEQLHSFHVHPHPTIKLKWKLLYHKDKTRRIQEKFPSGAQTVLFPNINISWNINV